MSVLVAVALPLVVAAQAGGAGLQRPGTWCGGTRWKLMTLSDTLASKVKWTPTPTSIPAIAELTIPQRYPTVRHTRFELQRWQVTLVIERDRLQSNGEIALELYDIPSSTYMNAYMPNPHCLSAQTRDRKAILKTAAYFVPRLQAAAHILVAARGERASDRRRLLEPGEDDARSAWQRRRAPTYNGMDRSTADKPKGPHTDASPARSRRASSSGPNSPSARSARRRCSSRSVTSRDQEPRDPWVAGQPKCPQPLISVIPVIGRSSAPLPSAPSVVFAGFQ